MPNALKYLELTDDEHAYLRQNIGRLYDRREKFPDKSLDALGSSLDILHRHLVEGEDKSFQIRRKERRLLQIFLSKAVQALEKSIIPGYKGRMITPKSKKKFGPYLERAKGRRDMIKALIAKIEKGL